MKYCDFLETLEGCPFCDEKGREVLENETALLTYALAPYHPDHLLVIPKRHIEHFLEIEESEMRDIEDLQKLGMKLLEDIGYKNISLLVREGDGSGKSVAHLHYHLIPEISLGNADYSGQDRIVLTTEEAESELIKLRNFCQNTEKDRK
jgi:diadenosine tetraphosphate (Ap4A) HIT family hydrolase